MGESKRSHTTDIALTLIQTLLLLAMLFWPDTSALRERPVFDMVPLLCGLTLIAISLIAFLLRRRRLQSILFIAVVLFMMA